MFGGCSSLALKSSHEITRGYSRKKSYNSRLKGHFECNGNFLIFVRADCRSLSLSWLSETRCLDNRLSKRKEFGSDLSTRLPKKRASGRRASLVPNFPWEENFPWLRSYVIHISTKCPWKQVLASFWSCLRNMLLIPGFETFNQIMVEDRRKMRFISRSVITSTFSQLVSPTVQNHLQRVNVISSQW